MISKDFLKLINNFGNIYLDYNNHIEKINHGSSKKKIIKVITYKELLLEISSFKDKTINYFFDFGLDKNTNQEGNITLIVTNNKNKKKLESHDFSYKGENKNIHYDIPYYHNNVPEGFSVFCTDEELKLVIKHVNKRGSKHKIKDKKKEENMASEPEPSKKNFICQLCRSRFDNYKEHIISETHMKNIKKNKRFFSQLSSTFKRIVNNNWKISKENSDIETFSNKLSEETDFSLQDFKRNNCISRIRRSPSFGKGDNNYLNFFMSSSKNNNIKIIRNENDSWSPQQHVSSTALSNCKNLLTIFDEISENNKNISFVKRNHKRKRDEDFDLIYEQLNLRNRKIKIN